MLVVEVEVPLIVSHFIFSDNEVERTESEGSQISGLRTVSIMSNGTL